MLVIGEEDGQEQRKRREEVEHFSASLDLAMKLASILLDLLKEGCDEYRTWTLSLPCSDPHFMDSLHAAIEKLKDDLLVGL